MESCEFCNQINKPDEIKASFPLSMRTPGHRISYELALFGRIDYGAKGQERIGRKVMRYGLPMHFCPECGRKL